MQDHTDSSHKSNNIDVTWLGVLLILLGFGTMIIIFSNVANKTNKATSSRAETLSDIRNACKTTFGMPSTYVAGYDFCAYSGYVQPGAVTGTRYCPAGFAVDKREVPDCPDSTSWTNDEHCCRKIANVNMIGKSLCVTSLNGNTNVECARDNSSGVPSCVSGKTATTIKCGYTKASTTVYTSLYEKTNYVAGHCCVGPSPTPTPFQPHGTVTDCGDQNVSVNCEATWGNSMNANNADNRKNGVVLSRTCTYDVSLRKNVCAVVLPSGDVVCDGKQYAYGVAYAGGGFNLSGCYITEKGTSSYKSGINSVCRFAYLGNALSVTQCQAIKNNN